MALNPKARIERNSIPEPNTGCWLWTGYCTPFGHAKMKYPGEQLAHRAAYREYVGEIPDGMIVRHRCDVPSCVNPDHLLVGTRQDNMDDRARRNRTAKGARHGKARLTDAVVKSIRESPLNHLQAAKAFGVSRRSVRAIRNRIRWVHI